jgi:hypothetical protein
VESNRGSPSVADLKPKEEGQLPRVVRLPRFAVLIAATVALVQVGAGALSQHASPSAGSSFDGLAVTTKEATAMCPHLDTYFAAVEVDRQLALMLAERRALLSEAT